MTRRGIGLLGVPTSAGAHWPGQEKAPRALREAGLVDRFVVHFDVDIIDFVDFPVADVPQHNAGLTFQDVMACLGTFAASPVFGGLVITELNPDPRGRARRARSGVRRGRRRGSQAGGRRVKTVISGRHKKRRRSLSNPSPRVA